MKTKLVSEKRVKEGVERLLSAPVDLASSGAKIVRASANTTASTRHRELFRRYMRELKSAIPDTMQWWNGLVQAAKDELGTRERALLQTWQERPAGPVSDPTLIALIRKYWLSCDGLNRELPPAKQVAPEVFLLRWLQDEGEDEAVEILSGMPYWPMGLDSKGRWI